MRIFGHSWHYNLCRFILVIYQPVKNIDLMDCGIVHSHWCIVIGTYLRISVCTVKDQRLAVFSGCKCFLDLLISLVIASHKSKLDEMFAGCLLCLYYFQAVLSSCT